MLWSVASDTALCAKTVYGNPTVALQDCGNFATPKVLRFNVGPQGVTPVSKMVAVPIIEDTRFEGDETFHVTLSGITGAGATLVDDTGIGTIIDDDPSPS